MTGKRRSRDSGTPAGVAQRPRRSLGRAGSPASCAAASEQGVTRRRLKPEELFAKEVVALARE